MGKTFSLSGNEYNLKDTTYWCLNLDSLPSGTFQIFNQGKSVSGKDNEEFGHVLCSGDGEVERKEPRA